MAEIKMSLTVEYNPLHGDGKRTYKVLRTKNTTVPKVLSFLTEEEVQGYIAGGLDVTVVPRKF